MVGIPCVAPSTTALGASFYSGAELEEKFQKLKPMLPKDKNVVKSGGWNNLKKLSGDPKGDLVKLIVDGLKATQSKVQSTEAYDEKLEALVNLLYAQGKGFEADLVDGDWAAVLSRQGTKSPKFQKLVGKGQSKGFDINTYDIETMTFDGDVKVLKKGLIYSKVKVGLVGFDFIVGNIPLLLLLPNKSHLLLLSILLLVRNIPKRATEKLYCAALAVISSRLLSNFGSCRH